MFVSDQDLFSFTFSHLVIIRLSCVRFALVCCEQAVKWSLSKAALRTWTVLSAGVCERLNKLEVPSVSFDRGTLKQQN